MRDIEKLVKKQREFFSLGCTNYIKFRKERLRKLKKAVKNYEPTIFKALSEDLRKPPLETYVGEIGAIYNEIDFVLKRLDSWVKSKKVPTSLLYAFSTSEVSFSPKGVVFIIGASNYPIQLVLVPLVGALAAGNVVIVKPSEKAPKSASVIKKLINECFDERHVSCIEGGADVVEEVISVGVQHVFFTGGMDIGRQVASMCANKLIPFTLELGGKNPCVVDVKIDLKTAAKRIVWGKFFNAGQTCIAPDYVFIDSRVKSLFLDNLVKTVEEFFGREPRKSEDYARIIDEFHFDRLRGLLNDMGGKILIGGEHIKKELFFAPTIVTDIDMNSSAMNEEIFGPILPVIEYININDAINYINERPITPLALYIFSLNKSFIKLIKEKVSFGGCTVNDTLVHFSNPHLPFGSRFGVYHGYYSFLTFSNYRSVLRRSFVFDPNIRYAPYRNKLDIIKKLIK